MQYILKFNIRINKFCKCCSLLVINVNKCLICLDYIHILQIFSFFVFLMAGRNSYGFGTTWKLSKWAISSIYVWTDDQRSNSEQMWWWTEEWSHERMMDSFYWAKSCWSEPVPGLDTVYLCRTQLKLWWSPVSLWWYFDYIFSYYFCIINLTSTYQTFIFCLNGHLLKTINWFIPY